MKEGVIQRPLLLLLKAFRLFNYCTLNNRLNKDN